MRFSVVLLFLCGIVSSQAAVDDASVQGRKKRGPKPRPKLEMLPDTDIEALTCDEPFQKLCCKQRPHQGPQPLRCIPYPTETLHSTTAEIQALCQDPSNIMCCPAINMQREVLRYDLGIAVGDCYPAWSGRPRRRKQAVQTTKQRVKQRPVDANGQSPERMSGSDDNGSAGRGKEGGGLDLERWLPGLFGGKGREKVLPMVVPSLGDGR